MVEFPFETELKRDLLLRGHGDGTFENVSAAAGIDTSNALGSAAFWFDYDNDGKLDLFVKNYGGPQSDEPLPSRLYKNNGDGTFTPVTMQPDSQMRRSENVME